MSNLKEYFSILDFDCFEDAHSNIVDRVYGIPRSCSCSTICFVLYPTYSKLVALILSGTATGTASMCDLLLGLTVILWQFFL